MTTSRELQGLVQTIMPDSKTVLHNGRTMAEVQTANNSLEICKLSVVDERVKEKHIAKLEKENYTVNFIDFNTMLVVIDACDNMTDHGFVNRVDTEVVDSEVGFWSLIRGIVPGTLWCGFNDIAESYYSLGPNHRVDRCCRAHDHCPDKIKSFSRKQGLLNSTPYTKSNCECDRRFYNCLKKSNSSTGASVGNFYFNFLNLQCIDLRHPEKCSKWKPIRKRKQDKNITETDIFEQEEDIFVPNMIQNISKKEADIEKHKTPPKVGLIQQQENKIPPKVGLIQQQEEIVNSSNSSDIQNEPKLRTECKKWVIDVNQSPKLSFVDNTFEY